jgi:hypothetical protein
MWLTQPNGVTNTLPFSFILSYSPSLFLRYRCNNNKIKFSSRKTNGSRDMHVALCCVLKYFSRVCVMDNIDNIQRNLWSDEPVTKGNYQGRSRVHEVFHHRSSIRFLNTRRNCIWFLHKPARIDKFCLPRYENFKLCGYRYRRSYALLILI